ncbi:MAG: citrate/2-methylcitrate synthase [Spirochaetaceae bacterium]|jgi:citrate synthase|nr:citrate/2-methylcitrate synthase [Spirochaetaceae bacterium]
MSAIHDYVANIERNDDIDFSLYDKYNVKRGLRNADGTGVLVGLTRVGDVKGYEMRDGVKVPIDGKLFYRGVDLEDIVFHAASEHRYAFEETAYLLMFGSLPNAEQLEGFCLILGENRPLPPNFAEDNIMKSPSRNVMNKLARAVLTLYSSDKQPEDQSPENVLRQCIEIVARFPTMLAYSYMAKKHYFDGESLILHFTDKKQQTAETILSLIRSDQRFTREEAELLDLALILHAEHGGGNNSTFSVHLVTSADTDTYAALSCGINSLKGSKHGGANYKVMRMMEDIKNNVRRWDNEGEVAAYLAKILRRETFDRSGLIYGQGHAVYTKSDPRAILLRNKAADLVNEKHLSDEFSLYRLVERLVPEVFRKVKPDATKDLCTNVDFYSGFVYKMLGIPEELYTPLFAASRITGWCAHRLEEIVAGRKIIRPAYKCVQDPVPYTPLNTR